MKYRAYHDESKEGGFWHGILLIPESSREPLLELMRTVRENTRHSRPIGLKNVKTESGPAYRCALALVQIGIAGMQQRFSSNTAPLYLGHRDGKACYGQLDSPLGLKFICFRSPENHADLHLLKKWADKVETTYRVALKGGVHRLGSNDTPIELTHLHFDGHQHYRRRIDRTRVVKRMTGLRSYFDVDPEKIELHDGSSDHDRTDAQEYNDCQLLQLADLMIGSFRTALNGHTREAHRKVAHPVTEVLGRYFEGAARMRNSRWRDSLCLSQYQLVNGEWRFDTIEPLAPGSGQGDLFTIEQVDAPDAESRG